MEYKKTDQMGIYMNDNCMVSDKRPKYLKPLSHRLGSPPTAMDMYAHQAKTLA